MTCRGLASCALAAAFAEAQSAIKRHNAKPERIAFSPTNWPSPYMVRGPHRRNANGHWIAQIGVIVGLPQTILHLWLHTGRAAQRRMRGTARFCTG
jgi:hypothetical protein